jgi:hypothetical protein
MRLLKLRLTRLRPMSRQTFSLGSLHRQAVVRKKTFRIGWQV